MQPVYLDILMPPLIEKWQQLSNSDKDLFPLLECFTSIAHVCMPAFLVYDLSKLFFVLSPVHLLHLLPKHLLYECSILMSMS